MTVGERPVEPDVVLGGAGRLAGTVLTADGTAVREGGHVITELVAGEYTLAAGAPASRPAVLRVTVRATGDRRPASGERRAASGERRAGRDGVPRPKGGGGPSRTRA